MTDTAISREPDAEIQVPYIHIHNPQPDMRFCKIIRCPTCERLRRFFVTHTPWYGFDYTCAGCGEQWQDDEMLPRPFSPGWRRRNREYARRGLAAIGVQA